MRRNRRTGQAAAILILLISTMCGVCGGIQSLAVWASPDIGDTIELPYPYQVTVSREVAVALNTFGVLTIVIPLFLVGILVWYLFGRNEQVEQRGARAGSLLLIIAGTFILLLIITQLLLIPSLDGMILMGVPTTSSTQYGSLVLCSVPMLILFGLGVAIWVFFVRNAENSSRPSRRATSPPRRRS